MGPSTVRSGLDILVEDGFARLAGARVGLLAHPASVDRNLAHAVPLFQRNVDLRAVFGPQHGFRGETQDNMIEWDGFTDAGTGIPIHSLYGATRKPTPEMLADIDLLAVDLQDAGARYYTFIWTLLLSMEACAEAGKRVVVLDRPNPIGASEREGPVLDLAYRSFVGLAPIPIRHGMTIGELARFFVREFALDVELSVIGMEGYRRDLWFEETDLPWVLPSPNLPTVDTAGVYPGMCLLEGTRLSEGRGTTRPFEIFGAPYVDPDRLVAELAREALPGVTFRPLHFEPTFQKHAGMLCGGAQIHVTDRAAFRPVLTAAAILRSVRALWPDDFRWLDPPYEYEHEKLPIDILTGGTSFRRDIEAGRPLSEMAEGWSAEVREFEAGVRDLWIYD